MKKPWIYLAVSFVVALALCLAVSWPGTSSGSHITLPTLPPLISRPTGPSSEGTDPNAAGEVRLYLGEDPWSEQYAQLLQMYREQTGRTVTIVKNSSNATIFSVTSQADVEKWQDKLYDLTDSAALGKLYNPSFALTVDGKPVGLAMDVTGYGIIYNASLLGKAGYTRTDITDLASLQNIVEFITSERGTLGFQSFGNADFDGSALINLLAGMEADPELARTFVDLYLQNDAANGNPKEQFADKKVVFYVGGAWEYGDISGLGTHNMDFLPIFTPDGGSFHCICNNYWCVSSQASEKDIQASLDFLDWMVTAGEGAAPVDSLGFLAPFTDAAAAKDGLHRLLRKYIATEPVTVHWENALRLTQQKKQLLADALDTYAASPNDETWAAVAELLQS